jgi:hypothetical protein
MATSEPRNPFYLLLLLASLLFVATALAYGITPLVEERAAGLGEPAPPSAFRIALRNDGWRWLFYELIAMTVLGGASMGLDRLRSLRSERAAGTISTAEKPPV